MLGLPGDNVVAMVITFGYPESEQSLHHGRWRHELYRWPIERRVTPGNVLWDIKERVAAPESWEEEEEET